MTFLDDELSAVTGQYDDLLSIEDVIDQELILFVSLNANKNTEPVRSLGKMLLQNIQLTVGKRYEDQADRRRQNRPIFSVVLDEFAPFGYRNFAQILQTRAGNEHGVPTFLDAEPSPIDAGRPAASGRRSRRRRTRPSLFGRGTKRPLSISSRRRPNKS